MRFFFHLREFAALVFGLWLGMGLIALAQTEPQSLREALAEMNAVETQIQRMLAEQTDRQAELGSLDADRQMARELMTGGEELRKKGQAELEALQMGVKRQLGALEEATLSGRRQLQRSRRGVRLAAPLLLHQGSRAGPADSRTVGLGLLQIRQRKQAQLAVEKLLRLERLQTDRRADRRRLDSLARRHARFAGMKLSELRQRHRELSQQLDRMHREVEQTRHDIVRLSEQRRQLNELIAQLAPERGPEDAVGVAALRERTPPRPALPPSMAPQRLNEVPYENEAAPGQTGPKEDENGAIVEGHRRVFWRAQRSELRALAAGTVLFSGAFAGYRHLLVIDHGGGWTSVYGNLSTCALVEGQEVAAGEFIGDYRAGENGPAEPFWVEARYNTRPAPLEQLPGAGASWAQRLFGENL